MQMRLVQVTEAATDAWDDAHELHHLALFFTDRLADR